LFLRSEEFDNAYWDKGQSGDGEIPVVTANQGIAPDGTMTADRVVFNIPSTAIDSQSRLVAGSTSPTGQAVSSVFLKSNTSSSYTMRFRFKAEISLITVTPEWQRLDISANNASNESFQINLRVNNAVFGGTDNFADILIWGAQLEPASTASSYIPTVASTVTRVADVISNDLSALVTGDYSMVLDVEANVGRLKVFESLTGFEVDLTGSGRMVVTVASEITLHFPDGRTLEFLKPSDFIDLEFITKLTSNHVKVVATLNRIINQSEIDGLVSGNLNSPLLDTGSVTNFVDKYRDLDYDFFGKIDTSSGTSFVRAWQNNNLTSFPLIDTSNAITFASTWRDNNLTSFSLIDMSSATLLQDVWRDNNLQTWPANMFDTCPATDFARCWTNNALDQTGVDNILVSINKAREDGFSGSNGTLNIAGGTNATPGAAGQAAADALRADGWTVTLNGY
jgi:hypothetical protein